MVELLERNGRIAVAPGTPGSIEPSPLEARGLVAPELPEVGAGLLNLPGAVDLAGEDEDLEDDELFDDEEDEEFEDDDFLEDEDEEEEEEEDEDFFDDDEESEKEEDEEEEV